ncbi:MAG: hypothetical protein U1F40_03750 [Turneriella sp.]|nr:hypothetical protein [Turneriella sp.]HNL52779.1 hypothetical protein [Turneriella sp.]
MRKVGFLPLLFVASLLTNCTGELPLSDLINNTITLKVLGTYESNDPYAWRNLAIDDVMQSGNPVTGASPAIAAGSNLVTYVTDGTTGLAVRPNDVKFYIDIAEIRLARGQGKSSSQSISDYWSQFAIDRQLMCSDYSTAESGRILQNCSDQNGIQKLYDFFNGGFTYPAVDVEHGVYNHLGIYFRRFVTSPAVRYSTDGTYTNSTTPEQTVTAAFDNRTMYGFDIETLMQNNYGENSSEPRMFPLQRKDLNLQVYNDSEPYVLEIRVFVKNNMMVHILQPNDATNAAFTYVAPPDWNVNHAFTDSVNGIKQGGAMLMTARTYQPAKVGSIQFTAASTNGHYFAVMPAGTSLGTPYANTMPLAATRATNTVISNLPAGSYDVYKTCDLRRCTNASTAGSCDNLTGGTDNYPETYSLCTGGPYVVTAGTTTSVTTGNCTSLCP